MRTAFFTEGNAGDIGLERLMVEEQEAMMADLKKFNTQGLPPAEPGINGRSDTEFEMSWSDIKASDIGHYVVDHLVDLQYEMIGVQEQIFNRSIEGLGSLGRFIRSLA